MCIVVCANFRIIRYEIAENIATGNEVTGIQMLQPMADFLTFLVSVPFQIVFFRKYLKVEEADGSL